ncbi:MAG: NADH-ubiquinone oxidoreductase chain [Myxococcaceae bacterium]|nr:NADH-ubiquinone oxidoreductase chain [Myxococcaceae bacterium]
MENFNELTLAWIVLFPLLGAVLNGIGGCFFKADKKIVAAIAVGAVALSFACAVYAFTQLLGLHGEDGKGALTRHLYEWFSVEVYAGRIAPVNVRFTMDALSGLMTVMVTGIGLLIHIYSLGYMSEEPSFARFFAYLNLFMASMLVLILASNLPLMFVGWEGVGLCSYLLIGFWFENPDYAAAGKKAFIVNRIGDFGVLIGMFILLGATGSFEFTEINRQAATLPQTFSSGLFTMQCSVATLAALFLFLGCTGKSAQIPLYVWLPDAMAGPTPVSALIHAATMVTSGVYLCCRLSPVFAQSPTAMAVIAVIGTLTALVAASIALVQNQLKKVLAYSTVSQLGFMFAAVGVGAFQAGIFHVFTHAFFKACLFLGAGSVMHAVHAHGDADLGKLGGMKKWMPWTRWTFALSCAAIAGLPLTSGFFSKDMILHGALNAGGFFPFAPWLGQAVFGALVLAAFGTAFYMFRLYFLTFTGEFRGGAGAGHGDGHGHDDHAHDDAHGHGGEPHESEPAMTIPLAILATGAIVVGFLGMPAWAHVPDFWSEWLHGVIATTEQAEHGHHDAGTGMIALIAGSLAGLGGFAFAWVKYRDKAWHEAEHLSPLHQFLMDKWRVDGFYNAVIVRPMSAIAQVAAGIDRVVVDGMTKVASGAVALSGWLFTRMQTGAVHAYGTAMAFGIIALTWFVLYPHPRVETASKGDAVHFLAGSGLSYEYRWDFDSDGTFDTAWGKDQRDVTHAYDASAPLAGVEIRLIEIAGRNRGAYKMRLHDGDAKEFSVRHLGEGWQVKGDNSAVPVAHFENGKLYIRAGGTSLTVGGTPRNETEVEVAPGSAIQLGPYAKLQVDSIVKSTLAVRNVFGNVAEAREEVVIQTRAEKATASAAGKGRPGTALAQREEAR